MTTAESEEFRKLVDQFGSAALRAGASNSGYVIDIMSGLDWERMQELRAKLLAYPDKIKSKPVPRR